jgi:enoyl-CoA hydratase/carnithine racemase
VILAAEGPVFSAGHDFSDMAGATPAAAAPAARLRRVMRTIHPQPVVAQVQGWRRQPDVSLATCDLAVCGESSAFQVPGGRGGWFCTTPGVALARAVGRKKALEMLLTGDAIDAQAALTAGLVNRVVPDERVAEQTRDLLRRATRGSTCSKGLGKQAFYRHVDMEITQAYEYATEVMASASRRKTRAGRAAGFSRREAGFRDDS